eukprot:127807-Amphidinium_carterae.1
MSSPQRLSQFAHTPAGGLAQFLHKHGPALDENSRSILAAALQAAGSSDSHAAEQTPLRVSIATPRALDAMDIDEQ